VPFAALFPALAMAASMWVWQLQLSLLRHPLWRTTSKSLVRPKITKLIAPHFDLEAAQAMAIAEQYKEFNCHHSKATELQGSGTRFAEITAKRALPENAQGLPEQGRGKPRVPSQYRPLLAYGGPVARWFWS